MVHGRGWSPEDFGWGVESFRLELSGGLREPIGQDVHSAHSWLASGCEGLGLASVFRIFQDDRGSCVRLRESFEKFKTRLRLVGARKP